MGTCFVIMPISTPEDRLETYHDRELHFAHVLDHLFSPALKMCKLDIISPVINGSDLIHAEIIKNLEQADLVLCDISCLNPNVFFELGIRTALDRPITIVKDDHTQRIPFDTGSINTYTYDSSLMPWSLETQIPSLAEHIRSSVKGANGRNIMWRYFGLTQRAAPADIADPMDAKLSLILSELTKLNRPSRETEQPGSSLMDSIIPRAPESPRAPRALDGSVVPPLPSYDGKPASPPPRDEGPQVSPPSGASETPPVPLKETVKAAHAEGLEFGSGVARDAPALWLEAVLARKPRMPSELEARLLQDSHLPIDSLMHDEVRHALRRGFWEALERARH
jgi:hypothetical protein